MTKASIRLAFFGDDEVAGQRVQAALRQAGLDFEWRGADSLAAAPALLAGGVDLALAHFPPAADGLDEFLAANAGRPWIALAAPADEAAALAWLERGACDCLCLDRLARLPRVVTRAVAAQRGAEPAAETGGLWARAGQALVAGASHALVLLEAEGRILDFNALAADQARRLYGRPLVRGAAFTDYFSAPQRADFERQGRAAWLGQVGNIEVSLIGEDGRPHWLQVRFFPVRSDADAVVAVCLACADITEARQAEALLRGTSELFRSAIDALVDNVCVLDGDGRLLAVNRAWREFLDANRETDAQAAASGEGVNYLAVCERAAAAGDADAGVFAQGLQAVLAGARDRFEHEYPCHSPTERRWFIGHVRRISGPGPARAVVAHQNITALRLAELHWRESRQLLHTYFDHSPSGMALLDTDLRFVAVNQAMAVFNGMPVSAHLGRPLAAVDADMAAHLEGLLREVLATGQPRLGLEVSGPSQNRPGQISHYLASYFPVTDADKRRIGVGAVVTDITERVQAERARRASEAAFNSLFENSQLGIAQIPLRGDRPLTDLPLTRVNASFARLLGETPEALAARTVRDITFQPDLERDVAIEAEWQRSSTSPSFRAGYEKRYVTRDGRVVPVLLTSVIVPDEARQPASILALVTDLTELRQRETELRTLAENSPDLIMRVSADMRCLYVNRRFRSLGTLAPLAMAGKALNDLGLPAAVAARAEALVEGVVRTGQPAEVHFTLPDPDGPRWQEARVVPEFAPDGRVASVLGLSRDITDRVRAEQALARERILFEAGPAVGYERDRAGTITYITPNVAQFGYTPLAFTSGAVSLPTLVPPEDWARVRAQIQADQAAGRGWGLYEYRLRCADGSERWVLDYTRFLPDDPERAAHGYLLDITERKRSEAIWQARARLAEFASTHSLGELLTATLDEVEALTDSRIGFYHFLEADQHTLSLQAWSTRTVRESCTAQGFDRHYDVSRAGIWVDCIRERRPVIHNDYAAAPGRQGMPDGHAAVTREVVVPVFRGDQIVAVLGVGNKPWPYGDEDVRVVSLLADLAWDIAERKQAEARLRESEQRFRAFFENAPLYCYMVAPDGRILDINRAALQAYGYTRAELVGQPVTRLYTPELEQRAASLNAQWRATGELRDVALSVATRTGTTRTIELSLDVVRDEAGQILYSTSIQHDVTERLAAEAELQLTLGRLRIVNQITQGILAARSPVEIAQTAVDQLAEWLPCEHVGVGLFDPDATLRILAARVAGRHPAAAWTRLAVSDVASLRALQGGEMILGGPEVVRDFPAVQALVVQAGLRSLLAVPLSADGRVIGTLGLAAVAGSYFTAARIAVVREIADELGVVLSEARLRERAQAAEAEYRALARRLVDLEETERRRLARELHDQVGQNLGVLGLELNRLRDHLAPSAGPAVLDEALSVVADVIASIRGVMSDLRPPVLDDYGLVAALRWYGEHVQRRTGLHVVVADEELSPRLPAPAELALFRITQEALNNVHRHARAQRVDIYLEAEGPQATLTIADDGQGFDPAAVSGPGPESGWGLINMRERAAAVGAQLRAESGPSRGTHIIVEIPR